jgi:hypothetical protein
MGQNIPAIPGNLGQLLCGIYLTHSGLRFERFEAPTLLKSIAKCHF